MDYNLEKLLPQGLRIEKVRAFELTKPRLIGDIGLRAFFQLYKRAKQLIRDEKIDFLYIPIPSYYCALLGRFLHGVTGLTYGIDYIDPWVHNFPGSDKIFSRHWFSTKIAGILEPFAIKKASLITGVAEGYFQGVIERNHRLLEHCIFRAMPYGGETLDHAQVKLIQPLSTLFKKNGKFQFVYAGAMLPKAYLPLEKIFENIVANPGVFADTEFHFIGTGKKPEDPLGFNIKHLAEKFGLWQSVIFEYPERIPYLDVLVHLNLADGIFILGSTEPHYTPSKVYQGILSEKPVFSVLHNESTAVRVLQESKGGTALTFGGEPDLDKVKIEFADAIVSFKEFTKKYNPEALRMDLFAQYSAKNVTGQLAKLLDEVTR